MEATVATHDHGERDLGGKLNSGLSSQRKRGLRGWEAFILHLGLFVRHYARPKQHGGKRTLTRACVHALHGDGAGAGPQRGVAGGLPCTASCGVNICWKELNVVLLARPCSFS